MRPVGFLAGVGATALALALATVALTVWVDPYRMYGTPVMSGWTALKPRIDQQTGIAKTYQLERVEPRTLLLGNSRVEIGIDPESREWPHDAEPVFDAAEDGRGLPTVLAMLREAIAVRIPDTVLLGVDILDFLQNPTPPGTHRPPPGADARRLLVDREGRPNPQRAMQIWRDRLATTLTISAVYDSIATLLDQNPSTSGTMTPQGFNPLHPYRTFVARSGYHELFAQKAALYQAEYSRLPHPSFADPYQYSSFRYLRRIMVLAARHKIRLILYIHPYHADYLEMLHRVGLWPSFDAWKRALVRVVDSENRLLSADMPLYDFAEYDRFTTEPVPPPGDRHTKMQWYWESAHYKSALGDRILARIFGGAKGFGSQLTAQNIDARLAGINAARVDYLNRRWRSSGGLEAASARAPAR